MLFFCKCRLFFVPLHRRSVVRLFILIATSLNKA